MKKKRKNKGFSKKRLEILILSIFRGLPLKSLNYKQISKKLRVKDSVTKILINEVLISLAESKILNEVKRGTFKMDVSSLRVRGEVISSSRSGVYVRIEEGEVFVPVEHSLFSLKGDVVTLCLFKKKKGVLKGEIVEVLERKRNSFVGHIQESLGFGFLVPDGNVPFDIFIPKKSLVGDYKNKKILVNIIDWKKTSKNPVGKIVKVLGNKNEHTAEIHSILYQYGLSPSFPKNVEKSSSLLSEKIPASEIKRRVDFRKCPTFTIDPKDAKDYDDALSVKKLSSGNWEVGVHIADVGFYVKENDFIDEEALNRSTSVYLVDRVVPMLPEILSNNICSLKQGVDRLCYSVILEMNEKADILSYQIKKTVIHSDKRFTYEQAQQIIDDRNGVFSTELSLLSSLSKKMRKKRLSSGSINFERDEVKFILDKKNNPVDVFLKKSIGTNHLVEEFMLTANKVVAKTIEEIKERGKLKAFVYRVHDVPDEEKIKSLSNVVRKFGYSLNLSSSKNISSSLNSLLKKVKGKPESNMIEVLSVRSMSKAEYSTNNIGHYGLGFKHYSHFTSPIRRYPDLIVHRLLEKYLNGGKSEDIKKISQWCKHCSEKEKDSSLAERDSIKYMQTKFLSDKIGFSFFGIISGVTEWGIYIELEKNKCEGLVKISSIEGDYYVFDKKTYSIIGRSFKKKYQLGDRVKIKVVRSNLETKQIDFNLIQ